MSRAAKGSRAGTAADLPPDFDTDNFDATDSTTWGDTAESIWKYLDTLQKSDPAAYKKFIAQQKAEAKAAGFAIPTGAGGADGTAGAGDSESDEDDWAAEDAKAEAADGLGPDDPAAPDHFVPNPAFVISTNIVSQPATKPLAPEDMTAAPSAAGAGRGAAGAGAGAGAGGPLMRVVRPDPELLFVNICGSPLMAPARRKSDRKPITTAAELDAALSGAPNVLMPLSVGVQLFHCTAPSSSSSSSSSGSGSPSDNSKAAPRCYGVDVAFHSLIADRAATNRTLQYWVIELALQHVEADHKLKLGRGPMSRLRLEHALTGKFVPMLVPGGASGGVVAADKLLPHLTEAGIRRIKRKRAKQQRMRERMEKRAAKRKAAAEAKARESAAAKPAIVLPGGKAGPAAAPSSSPAPAPATSGATGSAKNKTAAGSVIRLGDPLSTASEAASTAEPLIQLKLSKATPADRKRAAAGVSLVQDVTATGGAGSKASAPSQQQPQPKPKAKDIKLHAAAADDAPLMQLTQTKVIRTAQPAAETPAAASAASTPAPVPTAAAVAPAARTGNADGAAAASSSAVPPTPTYALTIDRTRMELTVLFELPNAARASDVVMDVAPRLVKLTGAYQIDLNLPVAVDDTRVSAAFSRKQHTLKLTAPITSTAAS